MACERPAHLTPHTSHPTPHTSHLTPHTAHLTPHTSHLTRQTSHLTPHTPHTSNLTPHNSHPHLTLLTFNHAQTTSACSPSARPLCAHTRMRQQPHLKKSVSESACVCNYVHARAHTLLHTLPLSHTLTPHTLHISPQTTHLTPHTSHCSPHTSHLTPHTSHVS
jgi:hypothetical protein